MRLGTENARQVPAGLRDEVAAELEEELDPNAIAITDTEVAVADAPLGTVIAAGGEIAWLTPTANILSNMTDVPPAAMITFGLGLIGLRGKDG